jgi:hypothetical protein
MEKLSCKGREMRLKVQRTAQQLTDTIKTWPSVECVSLGEAAGADILDPYFSLVLDVYYRGAIPGIEERKSAYGMPTAFESSTVRMKDRFFQAELPVRIEYKSIERVEDILDKPDDMVWVLRDSGTYMFYRIVGGTVLFKRSEWIDGVRKRLAVLSSDFWDKFRESFQAKMEHYLSDLGTSALQNDEFFNLISSAGFIRNVCSALFMINRRFEPSHRFIVHQLHELEALPDGFWGRWDSFMRSGGGLTPSRKYEVACLIAKSIVQMESIGS